MTRHYLGFSSKGATAFRNVRKDDTGEPLIFLDQDAVTKLQLNFAQWLETGETISTVSATAEGVTVATATSSPNVTLTLSASTSDGKVTLVVTFSSGEKWRGIIRVRQTNRYGDELVIEDYV